MKITEATPVKKYVEAARKRIEQNTMSWSVFSHPMRGDLSPVELLVFAAIFENVQGLSDTQATRAALAAVAALQAAEQLRR